MNICISSYVYYGLLERIHMNLELLTIQKLHYSIISLQLTNEEEKLAFIDDYRITACISILQWFVMEYKKYGASGVESYDAKARRSVVEFSLQRCKVKKYELNAR